MGMQVEWNDSRNTVILHFSDSQNWDWSELQTPLHSISQTLARLPGFAACVLNMRDVTKMPPQGFVEGMRQLNSIHTYGNIDIVVIVMNQSPMIDLMRAAIEMYGESDCSYLFCHSLQEAEFLINGHRSN